MRRGFGDKLRAGILAGMTTLGLSMEHEAFGQEKEQKPSATASQPEAKQEHKEKIKLPLPKIQPQAPGNAGDATGLNYRNKYNFAGQSYPDVPDEGLLLYESAFLSHNKAETQLRKVDHELCHQQIDHLSAQEKHQLVQELKPQIEKILKVLVDYEAEYAAKKQIKGEAAADYFLVNEMLAHVASYVDIPLPLGPTPTFKDVDPAKYDYYIKEGMAHGQSREEVIKEIDSIYKDPTNLYAAIEGSGKYDETELTGFQLQLLLPDVYKQIAATLKKHTLGENVFRSKEVLDKIKIEQQKIEIEAIKQPPTETKHKH